MERVLFAMVLRLNERKSETTVCVASKERGMGVEGDRNEKGER